MRLILLGSGEFGVPTFRQLAEGHDVAAVITQPDRPAGRRRRPAATPVGQWAAAAGLGLSKCENANDAATVERVREFGADAAVVIAFGQKLGVPLVDALGRLVINLHASLLPKYRGAAPINWAVISGEQETGLSVIGLAEKMDAGPVYARAATAIDPLETAGELHDRLAEMGPGVIEQVLEQLATGTLAPQPQDETLATLAPKLTKADGSVDFTSEAQSVRDHIHGLTPWPGVTVQWRRAEAPDRPQPLILRRVEAVPDLSCFIPLPSRAADRQVPEPGTVLADQHVAVGDGAIRLREVQLPGKKALPIDQFVRGHPLQPGDRLESG